MSAGFAAIFNQPVGGPVEFAITGDPTHLLANIPYSFTFGQVGGVPPISWSASGLPVGLNINDSTGEVSGVVGGSGMTISGANQVYVLVGVYRDNIEFLAVGGDMASTTFSETGSPPPGFTAATETIGFYKARVFSGAVASPDFGFSGFEGQVYVLAGVNRVWWKGVSYGGDQVSMDITVTSGTLPPGLAANQGIEGGSTVLKIEGAAT